MAPSRSVTAASERRPGLARRALVCAVEAARMEAQRRQIAHIRDAPARADRWPQACQGSAWPRRTAAAPPRAIRLAPAVVLGAERVGFGLRQAQEPARLVQHIAEGVEPAGARDHVEQIAMLPGREVGPMAGSAWTTVRSREAHRHAAARRVIHIADAPDASLAAAVGEVVRGTRPPHSAQGGVQSRRRRVPMSRAPPDRRRAAADSAP